jgi:putative tryptophan/tyrosine transport system substrate-binding protein
MRRREFIAGLGSAAASAVVPLEARAQQVVVRRVGVLVSGTEDQIYQTRIDAFRDGLAKLGWVEDRNLRIDVRFGGNDAGRIRAYATELVSLAPDAIVIQSTLATRAVQQQTRTIPIVITGVGDPLANGLVKNIARPEGNITGMTNLFSSIGSKWLELLKEAAPNVQRAGFIHNTVTDPLQGGPGYIPFIEEAARTFGIKAINLPYSDAVDIVPGIEAFASDPNCGLIVLPPAPTAANRETILRLATQHRLPAIYPAKVYVVEGGLMAYGSDITDNFRRASYFVDRILRGAKVSKLPIEFPTKFELVINLKAAKAIGLTISEKLLSTADQVIE